jgi:excisionase family DNA binding protein
MKEEKEVLMATGEDRRLLSVVEAAGMIGVSQYTLRAWLRQRRLAHLRLGRRVLFDPTDLARFIASNRVAASDEASP